MKIRLLAVACCVLSVSLLAQAEHDHPAPEKLGRVSFPTSCAVTVQPKFERAVALLHSFAYSEAEKAFRTVAEADPKCAIAHWGIAMSYYHELWEPWITAAAEQAGEKAKGEKYRAALK